jgi:hypothetical protein
VVPLNCIVPGPASTCLMVIRYDEDAAAEVPVWMTKRF